MPKRIYPSLEQIGIERHLEDTKADHNDLGYEKFVELATMTVHPSGKINTAAIARAFGVDSRTVAKWLTIYNKEQRNG